MYVHIYTTEPPKLVLVPSDSVISYGNTALLTCVAVSVEPDLPAPPTILWLKDSQLLSNSTPGDDEGASVTVREVVFEVDGVVFTRSILELCGVTLEEEGQYSCVAEDSAGTSTDVSFSLSIFTNGEEHT